jgi:hypothetical protein
MVRRTALKALVSLSVLGLLMFKNVEKSYAGSGGGSGGNDSSGGSAGGNDSSGGGSVGNDSSGGSSGGNDSSDGGSFGGNDSSTGGSSSDRGASSSRDGASAPDQPSGPDDSISGSLAGDPDSQNELIKYLDASLQSDGLETVTPDNLQSILESFK